MAETRYRRSPDAVWRASAGFLVAAVPPRAPTTIAGSVAMVWDLLSEPRTVDEVAALLSERAGAPTTEIQSDVTALLAQLLPLDLVKIWV